MDLRDGIMVMIFVFFFFGLLVSVSGVYIFAGGSSPMYKNPDPSKKRKNSTNEIYSISGYQQTTHYSYYARNAMLKYKVQTKPNPSP